MNSVTPVLVIDNGELGVVCAILEQLGADFERVGFAKARAPIQQPAKLLITTGAIAHSLRIQRIVTAAVPRPTWIVFVANDSKTQKAMLQKAGFDFLIRDPVHPAALRVLVQRALFRGADARRAPRVACGHSVTYKTGFWRQKGTLIDLSPRGCRILTAKPVKEKSEISIQIPKEMAGGRALDLVGHAVRVAPADREMGASGQTVVGVRFAPFEGEPRDRLRAVLAERVIGPAVLSAPVASPASPPVAVPVPSAAMRTKRMHKRARYDKKISAMEGEDAYMLLCRDLSAGGVRIEPVEGLGVGDRLDLAIQVSPREEPFLVEASIARDDGELGLALRFDWIAPESQERLKRFVETLPSIEALQDDARGQGTILAQRMPAKPKS